MFRLAVQGNYCSYPAMDADLFFKSVRTKPEFAEIRSATIARQQKFLASAISLCTSMRFLEDAPPRLQEHVPLDEELVLMTSDRQAARSRLMGSSEIHGP